MTSWRGAAAARPSDASIVPLPSWSSPRPPSKKVNEPLLRVVTVSFPTLKDIGLGLAYGLYAGFALLSFFFVLKMIEETKGKQLEDMHA